jgi:hypothetical protein
MPCGDVPGRVHVRVAGVAAGRAAEQRLALAAVCCHVPALGAALAGERGINLLHPPGSFVFQAAGQQAPPGRENSAVKARLLPDAVALLEGEVPDVPAVGAVLAQDPSCAGVGLSRYLDILRMYYRPLTFLEGSEAAFIPGLMAGVSAPRI